MIRIKASSEKDSDRFLNMYSDLYIYIMYGF